MKSLRDRILSGESPATSAPKNTCALRSTCPYCQSKGYHLISKGAIFDAVICKCVNECQTCNGSLMMSIDGKLKACRTPSPKRIVSLFHEAALPARYIDCELTSFRNFSGNGKESLQKILSWVDHFNLEKGPGLVLSGPVGVGKTYLVVAIAKHFIRKGQSVRFVDFHRMLSVIRAAYADRKSEEEILAPLIDAEILVIDELGKGRNNDWEQEKLDQIVMGRYNQNKFIIASTNYPLRADQSVSHHFHNIPLDQPGGNRSVFNPDVFEPLEQRVGKRIYSRLVESSIFLEMRGDDIRRTKRHDAQVGPSESRL